MSRNYNDVNLEVSPYSRTIEQEYAKGYREVLGKEGLPVSGQDFNNALAYDKKRLSSALNALGIHEGTILSGSLPSVDGTTVTILGDIYVWAKGEILNKPTTTEIILTGSGNETIGCTVSRYIIDYQDDPALLDPSTAYESPEGTIQPRTSGEPCGDRIKYEITFSKTTFEYPLWHFKDGILQNATALPNEIVTMEEIEHRTRDSSGNFSVNPPYCYVVKYNNEASTCKVYPNEYYVDGVRVGRTQEEGILIPHALSTEYVNFEGHTYDAATKTYALAEFPVKSTSDMGFTCEGYIQVTRGSTVDGTDDICSGTSSGYALAKHLAPCRDSLLDILEVYTSTGSYNDPHVVDYTIGNDPDDDCYRDGNTINWSHLAANGADEPATGTNFWVKVRVSVNGIKALREVETITNEAVNIASTNDKELAHNDVFGSIDSTGISRVIIGDAAGGDDYVEGTDFYIINYLDDGYTNANDDPNQAWTESKKAKIHWLITPPAGTVYVSYSYWRHTKEGHYIGRDSFDNQYHPAINIENLVTNKNTGYRKYISFETSCTEKPVDTSTFYLDYEVYRGRFDLIEVMSDANFTRIPGLPAEEPNFPSGHYTGLVIARLRIPPDSPNIIVENLPVECNKQFNIREMKEQVVDLRDEIQQLKIKLDTQAKTTRTDTEKGSWADDCINISFQASNGGDPLFNTGGVAYNVRSDPKKAIKTLKFSSRTANDLTTDSGSSTVISGTKFISLTRSLASQANTDASLKQLRASTTMRINPYGLTHQDGPYISLNPNSDSWIEEEVIIRNFDENVPLSVENQSVSGNGFFDRNTNVMIGFTQDITQLVNWNAINRDGSVSPESFNRNNINSGTWLLNDPSTTVVVRDNGDLLNRTINRIVTFIRQRTIEVTGTKYDNFDDNIFLLFDNHRVNLTPTGSTVAGTQAGTVKAKADGSWTATFVIPPNIPTGVKNVYACAADSGNTAGTIYTAEAQKKTIERIITPVPALPPIPPSPTPVPVPKPDEPITWDRGVPWVAPNPLVPPELTVDGWSNWRAIADPIGEEIIPIDDFDIGAIDLYFQHKDSAEGGFVHIRKLKDGDPSDLIKLVNFVPAEVSISEDSSVVTTFNLGDPVPFVSGENYFLAVGSESTMYQAYISESGGTDLLDTTKKLGNEYPGNARSSSNGLSWDILQTSDLKFALRPYVYANSGEWYSQNISTELTSFYLSGDVLLRPGTAIDWYYSIDSGTTWRPFTLNNEVVLSQMASQIKIKAVLSTTKPNVSPLIVNSLVLDTRKNNASSTYVGRNLHFANDNKFYKVTYTVEEAKPSGTTLTHYVSIDNGVTWVAFPAAFKTEVIDGEFTKYYYAKSFYLDPPILNADDLTAASGGALANGTYYYKITAGNEYGETIASATRSITLSGANQSVIIDLADVPTGATEVRIYRGTTTDATIKYILTSFGATFTDDGSDPDSDINTPPATPTARSYQTDVRIRTDMTTSDIAKEPKIRIPYARME